MGEIGIIVVVGTGKILPLEVITKIQESYGKDIPIITAEEAIEKGIISNSIIHVQQKPFILKPHPEIKMPEVFYDKHSAKKDCKKGWMKSRFQK